MEKPDLQIRILETEYPDKPISDEASKMTSKEIIENCGRWTDHEHDRFRAALLKFGRKWSKVARHVGTRTDA